jgi:hypothetical protein
MPICQMLTNGITCNGVVIKGVKCHLKFGGLSGIGMHGNLGMPNVFSPKKKLFFNFF